MFKKNAQEALLARKEVRLATLGDKNDDKKIDGWIKKAISSGNRMTNPWVLIGGPPCQAYSLAGRSRNKGKEDYKPEDDGRHYLYKEYLRIIVAYWPAVFVMENVKGLLSARVKKDRIFDCILNDLENPSTAAGSVKKIKNKYFFAAKCQEKANVKQSIVNMLTIILFEDVFFKFRSRRKKKDIFRQVC